MSTPHSLKIAIFAICLLLMWTATACQEATDKVAPTAASLGMVGKPASSESATQVPTVALAAPTLPSSHKSTPAVNLLVAGDDVRLRRKVGVPKVPISPGTSVLRGDMLSSQTGMPITILCADLTVEIITQEDPCPCSPNVPVLQDFDGRYIDRPLGVSAPLPYILMPRSTVILDPLPLLRWHNTNAGSYTVKIEERNGLDAWQASASDPELQYDGKPLTPGKIYNLRVTDNSTGAYSGDESTKGLEFAVLDAAAADAINQNRTRIEALDLSDNAKFFATAVYFATNELYAEALLQIERIHPGMRTAAMDLWRGRILTGMQLCREARLAYNQALEKATLNGELYVQAEANRALFCITTETSYRDAALQIYQQLNEPAPEILCPPREP